MKNKKFLLISIFLVGLMVSYSIPIQSASIWNVTALVNDSLSLGAATGPNLVEGMDGFYPFVAGDTLPYLVTYNNKSVTGYSGLNVGDIIQWNISAANNSVVPTGYVVPDPWIADCLWGGYAYYNSSTGIWESFASSYAVLSGYNSTHSFDSFIFIGPLPAGKYNAYNFVGLWLVFGYPMPPFPRNYTATNHTIVNLTYTMYSGSFDPHFFQHSPGQIAGMWQVGFGGPTIDDSFMLELELDSNGIVQKQRMYINGSSWWELGYEFTFLGLPSAPDLTLLLLTLLFIQPSTGLLIAVIIGVASAVGIIILFAFLENKGYLRHRMLKTKPY
jgi:hypothetical protein